MTEEIRRKIVLLDGANNYEEWRDDTHVRLIQKKLWQVVGGKRQTKEEGDDEWEDLNQMAWAELFGSMKPAAKLATGITYGQDSASKCWEKAKTTFAKKNNDVKNTCIRKLVSSKSTDFKKMSEYVGHLKFYQNRLAQLGTMVDDAFLANLLIIGLPQEMEPFWVQIVHGADQAKRDIEFDEVAESILARDARISEKSDSSKALKVGNFGK